MKTSRKPWHTSAHAGPVALVVAALGLVCLSVGACGSDDAVDPTGGGYYPPQGIDGGIALADLGPPPELELDVSFEPPAVGATVLYATNPGAGRVAVVHADDFRIETVAVGPQPLPAVAVPGADVALSLNRGDDSVHLLRSGPGDRVTETQAFALDHAANRAAFDPSGAYALLFEAEEAGELRTNLHDLSVLSLTPGQERVVRVVVGYGPSHVSFDSSGQTAFVITEDGVSVIDLGALPTAASYRAPLVGFGVLESVIDTQITPDGTQAVTRVAGVAEVRLLNLGTGAVQVADLSAVIPPPDPPDPMDPMPPTPEPVFVSDMDLNPAGDELFVVLRSHSLLVRIPLGAAFADDTTWRVHDLSDQGVGAVQLSSDGRWALLYSTINGTEGLTRLDLQDPLDESGTRLPLRKSVRAVAFSEGNAFALVLHHKSPGHPDEPGLTADQRTDRSHGYSVIDLANGFTRLELTDAQPTADGFVIDDAGGRMLVALRDDARAVATMQIMDLTTFAVDELSLLAPPTTLGTFPSLERAFVGQEADGGRVTFYLWPTRETQTVAGFELGAGVRR